MQRADLEALLPAVVRRTAVAGSPLDALLEVMAEMHAPVEAVLDDLGDTFDPYRCPDRFVPFLAHWLDLSRYLTGTVDPDGLPSGLGHLRSLVASAAGLAKRSGTVGGLVRFLEIATGVAGFAVDEEVVDAGGEVRPFVARLHLPDAARGQVDLINRIVDAEKPAYLVVELALPETEVAHA
jgi:phage tail-like protein